MTRPSMLRRTMARSGLWDGPGSGALAQHCEGRNPGASGSPSPVRKATDLVASERAAILFLVLERRSSGKPVIRRSRHGLRNGIADGVGCLWSLSPRRGLDDWVVSDLRSTHRRFDGWP